MMPSVLDLFTIGIGPSSSHTVGPMKAAKHFVGSLIATGLSDATSRITCTPYGSLAATGKGHGTDRALILGLLGHQPESVDLDQIESYLALNGQLLLPNGHCIAFDPKFDLEFKRFMPLPQHPNGMTFAALNTSGLLLHEETWFSLGGGFIVKDDAVEKEAATATVPYPFISGDELLAHCQTSGLSISDLVLSNENAMRPESETRSRLDRIWLAMQQCVSRGCESEGHLPGGLCVPRRAKTPFTNCAHALRAVSPILWRFSTG